MSKNYMNDSQASEIVKYISDTMKFPIMGAGGGFAPIGFYGWSADYVTGAPQGWLRCEGQEVNIADYPELATFYASQHGASNYWGGDGITTFAVPDLRGEYIRGAGTNSHANQGNGGEVGEHQDATEHQNYYGDNNYFASSADSIENGNSYKNPDYTKNATGGWRMSKQRDTFTDFPYAYTSRPTNTSGVFFVKATVSGETRHQYSTEEQIVDTWVDGRPVYERTWEIDNLNVTSYGAVSLYENGDCDFVVNESHSFYNVSGVWNHDYWYTASDHRSGNLNVNSGNIGMEIFVAGGAVTKIKITVQYVKTQ